MNIASARTAADRCRVCRRAADRAGCTPVPDPTESGWLLCSACRHTAAAAIGIDDDDDATVDQRLALAARVAATSAAGTTITLVSAVVGDIVPGIELSDPACPIGWDDLPADAQDWATAQGYDGANPSELLYVAPGTVEMAGWPALTVTI